ncbi:MAG TPA: zinc ribbon domain-containing protein [Planctomycetota bacterium]|nr:zinc ribbon domain-containing protein [Planctomycetota bacterium]
MSAATLQIHCPSCKGDIPTGAESCPNCGSPLPRSVAVPAVAEHKGWGADNLGAFNCKGCGAEIVVDKTHLKLTCAYCGSEAVIAQPGGESGHGDDVRPEALVNFAVTPERAGELFMEWLTGLWFAPSHLAQAAHPEKLRPVYLPFWGYDTDTHTFYRCEVGHETGSGKSRHTTWRAHSGWIRSQYRDVLVVASGRIDRDLSVAIEPFHVSKKVAFSPELLTGREAERYALDHEEAWKQLGRRAVIEMEDDACTADARHQPNADHVRNMKFEPHFENLASKHYLLPLYVSAFRYGDKTFQILVNGDTGLVHGQRPVSVPKVVGFVGAAVLLVVAIVALLAQSGNDGLVLKGGGFSALIIIGGAIAFVAAKTSEKGKHHAHQE